MGTVPLLRFDFSGRCLILRKYHPGYWVFSGLFRLIPGLPCTVAIFRVGCSKRFRAVRVVEHAGDGRPYLSSAECCFNHFSAV